MVGAEHTTRKQRNVSSRHKTGCLTCKKRRVKCDEGKPACERCLSTGRVCDGYGIWGGGGNAYGSAERLERTAGRYRPATDLVPPLSIVPCQFPTITGEPQRAAFDFFRRCTTFKLVGAFESEFWETLVLQASYDERPVLHGIIALGAAHKNAPRLALQEYNKSIHYLRPHLERQDRYALRVTLITCLLFISLELLRGELQASSTHLRNGLQILRELQRFDSLTPSDGAVVVRPESQNVEDYLIEAFSRMNILSELFCHVSPYRYHVGDNARDELPFTIPKAFYRFVDARKHLDSLLSSVLSLSREAIQLCLAKTEFPPNLYRQKGRLQTALELWMSTFESSRSNMKANGTLRISVGFPLLRIYHAMTTLMAATCLRGSDEMIYDDYTSNFISILDQTQDLWNKTCVLSKYNPLANNEEKEIAFTADMGFIPPLHYIAVKCRVPHVRRAAIELIKSVPHREGVWDGGRVAHIDEYIMALEEDGLPPDTRTNLPAPRAVVPARKRINDIHMKLPHSLGEQVTLSYRRYEYVGGEVVEENGTASFDLGFDQPSRPSWTCQLPV